MLAFPEMLIEAAQLAGIRVPPDLEKYNPDLFPHWHVFAVCQLGAPMPYMGVHWENAKIVAAIPEDRIRLILYQELLDLGFQVGRS